MPRGHPKGRRPGPCRHCDMCEEYRVERHRQEVAVEDGGFRDERAARELITFKVWLRHYPWPCRERVDDDPGEPLGEPDPVWAAAWAAQARSDVAA